MLYWNKNKINMLVTKNGTLNPLYIVGTIKEVVKNLENDDENIIHIKLYNILKNNIKEQIQKIYISSKNLNNLISSIEEGSLYIFKCFFEFKSEVTLEDVLAKNFLKIKIKKIKILNNFQNSKNLDSEIMKLINEDFSNNKITNHNL